MPFVRIARPSVGGTGVHTAPMLLNDLVEVSARVAGTSSRLLKRDAIAGLLRDADPDDAGLAVAYLSGRPRQRRTGVGWAGLSDLPSPAAEASLTLADVDAAFDDLAGYGGVGSAALRTARVAALFGRATAAEQQFLRALIFGDLLQGARESTVVEGIAAAFDVPIARLRRAVMFAGGPVPVAVAAATGEDLDRFVLTVGTPVQPMLAGSAPNVDDALTKLGAPVILDTKLDGIRVQAHKDGDAVRLFTRSLDDITERLPRVADQVRALPVERAVLDGEVLAVDAAGRPRPFQDTASATAELDGGLRLFFFDLLLTGGTSTVDAAPEAPDARLHRAPETGAPPTDRIWLDEPLSARLDALDALVPADLRTAAIRLDPADPAAPEQAREWFARVVADGQEGLVIKALDGSYQAGRRGTGWVKVKPRHTLDLVVIGVEKGNGRRTGTLSNIHMAARDGDRFVMVGKTFKGMTDAMLAWQTERFTELADGPTDGYVVKVRPEQVVEIAFDGVQRSTRYPGGVALRFARVLRYRDDKTAAEADTLASLQELLPPT